MALNRLKAGCGLQPVPEEPGLNGTSAWTADTNGTDCASSAKLHAEGSGDADRRCGNNPADCRFKSASCAEGGCSDGFLDNVSEKDYRIWFPRAEVPDDDAASRGLSDWRTFREYRYTECAQNGRVEKTLSVEHVHKRKSTPMADGQQTTVSFQCAPSCSTAHDGNGGDQIDGEFGRVLSSTKGQLYREHHTQLLSRQDDSTPDVPAQKVKLEPKLTIVQAGIEREKEEKEECQTRAEEFALANSSIKTVLANSLANEPDVSSAVVDSLLNDQDGHSSQLESAGFHDVAAASEDDDMDEQKSTYVRADNVDSEVDVMTSELKETVVGGPSLDDLGYIAEEPEDEIDESASDSERWNTVSIVGKEQTKKSDESRMPRSDVDTTHGEVPSSQSNASGELSKAGVTAGSKEKYEHIREETITHSGSDVTTGLNGESRMCGTEEQMQSSRKEETEKQDVRQYEGPYIIVTKTWLQESSLGTEVEALSKKEVAEFDRKDERRESLSWADAENKCIDLEHINAETDSANHENGAGIPVGNLELHYELIVKKEAEARSEGVEFSECNECIKEDLLRTSENAAASHLLQITDDLPHFEKEIAHVANSLERRDEDETFKVGTIEELDGGFWKKNEVLKEHPSHGDEDHRTEKGQKEEKEAFTSLVITEKDVPETADAVVSLGTQNEAGDAMRPVPDFQNENEESAQTHLALYSSQHDNTELLTGSGESMSEIATGRACYTEATQEADRSVSAIGMHLMSKKDVSSDVTAEVANEKEELSVQKVGFDEERQKSDNERPERVCNRSNEVSEPDKAQPPRQSEESRQDAAVEYVQVSEAIKQLENVSTIVQTSVSKKDVFLDDESKTVKENEAPDELEELPQQTSPKSLERASGEIEEHDTLRLVRASPVTGVEEPNQDPAIRPSDVHEGMPETLESRQGVENNLLSRIDFSTNGQVPHSEEHEKERDVNETHRQDLLTSTPDVPCFASDKGEILREESIQFAKVNFIVDSQEKTENILSCPTDVKPPIPAKRKSLSDISKESPFSKSVLQEETLGSLKVVNEEMNTPLHENAESRLAVSGEMLGENDEYQTHDVLPLNERTEAMIPADNAVEKTIVLEDNENSLELPEKELSAFQEPENRAMQDADNMVSANLNDQVQEATDIEEKAKETSATNICHLGDSTSLSIEANMLKDVMELTGIDDVTSLEMSLPEDYDQGCESLPCDQTTEHGGAPVSSTNHVPEPEASEKSIGEISGNFDARPEGPVGQDLSTTGECLPATKKSESTTADTMSPRDNMLLQSLNVDEIQETSQVSVRSNDGKENEETTQGRNFDCIENKNLQCSENERTHAVHPGSYETGESLEVAELTNVDEEPTSADQEGAVNRGMERANWSHGEADCQLGRLTEETNSTYKVEKGSENQELTNKTCKTEESVKFMSVESRFVENGTPKAENETSHDAFDVIEDAMVEADVKVPVIVFQEAYLEGEEEEERLRLRAYAEEVVSTVLSKCVAQLEENEHKFSGTENTKMNHDDLKQVTFSESSWGEGKENHTVALTERETLIEDLLDGNLRPIASRQSAFENAIPPENCQGNDVEEGRFETILTTSADKNFEEISKEPTVSKREASLTEPEKSDGADIDLLRSVDKILETSVDDFNQPLFGVSEAVIRVRTQSKNEPDVESRHDASGKVKSFEVLTEQITANKNGSNEVRPQDSVSCNTMASEVPTEEVTANENEYKNLKLAEDVHKNISASEVLTAEVTANENESENLQPEDDASLQVSVSEVLTAEVMANEHESENVQPEGDIPGKVSASEVLTEEVTANENESKNGQPEDDVSGKVTASEVLTEEVSANENEFANSTGTVKSNREMHHGGVDHPNREDVTQVLHPELSPKERLDVQNGDRHNEGARLSYLVVGIEKSNKSDALTNEETEMPTTSDILLNNETSCEYFAASQEEHNNSAWDVPVPERTVDARDHMGKVPTSSADDTTEFALKTTSEKESASTEYKKPSIGGTHASEELGTKAALANGFHDDASAEVHVPAVGEESVVTMALDTEYTSTEGEKSSMGVADVSEELGMKDFLDNEVTENTSEMRVPVIEESAVTTTSERDASREDEKSSLGAADISEELGTKVIIDIDVHEDDSVDVPVPVVGADSAVTTTSEKTDASTEGEKLSMTAADESDKLGIKDPIDNDVHEDDSAKAPVPVLEEAEPEEPGTNEEPGTKDSIYNTVHEEDSAKVLAPVLGEQEAVTTTSEKDAPTEGEKSSMAAADTSEEPGTKDSIDNAVDEDDSAKVSMPVLGEESAVTTTSEKDAPMKGEKSSMVAADTSEEPVTKEFIGNELYEDYSAEVPCLGVGEKSAVTTISEEENASTVGKKTSSMGVTEASQELGTNDFIETAVHEDDSTNMSVPVVGESAKIAQEDVDEVTHTTVETVDEASSLRQYSGRTDYDISEGWEPKAADNNATILHFNGSALKDQDPTVRFNSDANQSASSSNISIKNEFAAQQTPQEHSQLTGENSSISDNMYPHSDKDSLGALSTVYENSLEDAKFSVEENITGTDATTKFSNNEVIDTTASPELSLYNTADTAGGIFQENESNNENDQLLEPSESTDSSRSCPLQRATSMAGGNLRADKELKEGNYPEIKSSYRTADDVHTQGADGVLCWPTDSDNVSARIGLVCIPDNYSAVERGTSQIPEESASMQEFEDEVIGQEQVLSNNLQSTTQSEVSHDYQRANTDNDANHENEVTVVQKEERRTSADCHQNEVVAAFDTFSERTEGQLEVIAEHREPRPPNEHQRLHRNDQASKDEVATIDFSDEELQSLDQVSSQNCEYLADLQNSNDDSASHEVQKRRPEECVQNNSVSLEPRFVAVIDTDHKESITNDTVAETQGQFGKSQEECSVHGIVKSPDHISTLDASLIDSQDKSLFDSRQATIGSLKTAVLVHEATKLETVEWSEDPLNSVATEADFSSDIYEQAADGQNASISDAQNCEQVTDGLLNLPEGNALSSPGDELEISQPTNIDQDLEDETAKLGDDLQEREQKSPSSDVEDAIVPQHIDTSNDKPSSTDSEVESERGKTILDEKNRKAGKDANTDLKDAIEKFSTIISADSAGLDVNQPRSQEMVEALHGPVVTEVTDKQDEAESKGHSSIPTDAKLEHDSDIERKAENAKPRHSENILRNGDQNSLGHDDTQRLKEDTTHSVTESVEKSERTEREDADSNERSRLTRIFHRTVLRTESTRTVRKTRSFMPYSRDKDAAHTRTDHEAEVEPMDDTRKPVEETFVSREAFDAMSVPRRGLGPVTSTETVRTVRDVGVQALPSTTEKEVQVEFNEHDCIARLVELQIAMNEQEEVRRQDMKAACELVEKLEAMQLSETLMRSQIRAMDVERREQSAREARLRDELQAWQETVQQQQLLLQQLKEDLDDTEDTLAAQRQEANRLRERMLVLQESCDSGLLMADVLTRADKEVQTPDGTQHPLSASYKGSRRKSCAWSEHAALARTTRS